MIVGDEFETRTYNYITTEESSVVHHVPVISRQEEEVIFQSSSLESEETDDFFIKRDESILLTSTPNLAARHNDESRNEADKDASIHTTMFLKMDDTSYDEITGLRKCVTLLQSFSMERNDEEEDLEVDTLENHLFPDMSFTESEVIYDESEFKTRKLSGDSSWSKLHGVSYLSRPVCSSDDEVNIDCAINHPNRSHFRQRRREWYLNRRNLKVQGHERKKKDKIQHSYIRKIFNIFSISISVFYMVISKVIRKLSRKVHTTYHGTSKYFIAFVKNVFKPLLLIILLPWRIIAFTKRRMTSFCLKLFSLTNNVREERSKSKFSCPGIFCWVAVVVIPLFLFALIYVGGKPRKLIPNPIASGIDNAHSIYVGENMEIPAWHIYPKQAKLSSLHPVKKSLKDTTPVIMFLRNGGDVDTPQLKSMYETLFSLGYHIIIPTDVINQHEVIDTWKWIKTQTNATSYMWGFGINATTLTETAKVFCKHLVPPNGVIIAKEVKSENLHQTMEIWSCNCALAGNATTSYFKYNHVKCPVAFDNASNDVYSQVVACIETVNKNVDS